MTIKGVRAELLLKVRLDNVAAIIDRTLTTIDRHPPPGFFETAPAPARV